MMQVTVLQAAVVNVFQGPTAAQYAALSDADAAALLNQPVYTPRTSPITCATLGGADALGPVAAAALMAALRAAAAQTANPALQVMAQYAVDLLTGAGFSASDPGTAPQVQAMVSAGIVTQAQATAILNTSSYPAGSNAVANSDVTAARAYIALQTAQQAVTKQWASVYQEGLALIQAASSAAAVPTLAQLQALQPA